MKTLKFVAVAVLIVALSVAGIAAFAGKSQQVGPGRSHEWLGDVVNNEEIVELILSHIKEQLALTEEQEAEIRPILQAHIEERIAGFKARRKQIRDNVQTNITDRQALLQETEEQLAGILTEEQMQTLRQMVEEHWGHWQDLRSQVAQGDFQRRGDWIETLKELNLTLEQKKEIFSIAMKYRDMHKDTRENMQAIHTQFANTVQELLKNEAFDEDGIRQTYRDAAAQFEDVVVSGMKMLSEMKAVLTPEQQQILEERGAAFLEQLQEGGTFGQRFGFRDRMSKRHPMFGFRFHQAEK